MKTLTKSLMLAAVAATTILSCTKEVETPVENTNNGAHVEFSAKIADATTKATLTTTDDNSFAAAWVDGTDIVSLYAFDDGSFDEEAPATWNESKEAFEADFTTSAPATPGDWMYEAKYPYDADGNIPFGSPRVQNGNAYNSAYDIMYGFIDYNNALLGKDDAGKAFVIPMNRLTGIAYFHITGGPDEDVVSATLEATGIAAENVTISSDSNGTRVSVPDGSASLDAITITFADGTAPKATDLQLWFNVLPSSYSGLKLTINTTTKTAVLNSNKSITYSAGKLNKVVLSGLSWNTTLTENFSPSKAAKNTYDCSTDLSVLANRADFDYTWTLTGSGTVFQNGIKLGKSGGTGAVTSSNFLSSIPAGQAFTVKVYAAVWTTDGGSLVVTYNGESVSKDPANDAITTTSNSYSVDDFANATEFSFTKVDGEDDLTIASSSKRIIIDKVEVVYSDIPDPRTTVTLNFDPANPTAITIGDSFTEPTLTVNPSNAPISYSVETTPDGIATINETTGELAITGAGSITVTAAVSDVVTYKPASASYTLTVNPVYVTATATFTGVYSGGMSGTGDKQTGLRRNVTAVISNGLADASSNHLRIYSGAKLTISVPSGASITKVEFDVTDGYSLSNLSNHTNGIWSGNAESVEFSASSQVRLDQITVTYKIATSELAYYTPTITAIDKSLYTDDAPIMIGATSDSPGAITYGIKSGSSFISLDTATGEVTPMAVGTAVVTVNVAASGDYVAGSKDINITVSEKPSGTLKDKTLSFTYSSHSGWTITDATINTNGSYYILKSGASIESPSFQFNSIKSVVIKTRTYGGASYKTTNVTFKPTSGVNVNLGSVDAGNTTLTNKTLTVSTSPAAGSGSLLFSSSTTSSSNGPGVSEITINYDVYE